MQISYIERVGRGVVSLNSIDIDKPYQIWRGGVPLNLDFGEVVDYWAEISGNEPVGAFEEMVYQLYRMTRATYPDDYDEREIEASRKHGRYALDN